MNHKHFLKSVNGGYTLCSLIYVFCLDVIDILKTRLLTVIIIFIEDYHFHFRLVNWIYNNVNMY